MENGRGVPSLREGEELARAFAGASGETWRALVDALGLPVDAMLEAHPKQRAKVPRPAAPDGAASSRAMVVSGPTPARPFDLQAIVDDLIRVYAEEADMSARRLRAVLGMCLGEMRHFGLTLEEVQSLVLRRPLPRSGDT
jgi:hypothetical protein